MNYTGSFIVLFALSGIGIGCSIAALTVLKDVRWLVGNIMAREELRQALNDLKSTITSEKEEVKASISELETKITALEEAVQAGGDVTEEVEEVRTLIDDVKGIVDRPVPEVPDPNV